MKERDVLEFYGFGSIEHSKCNHYLDCKFIKDDIRVEHKVDIIDAFDGYGCFKVVEKHRNRHNDTIIGFFIPHNYFKLGATRDKWFKLFNVYEEAIDSVGLIYMFRYHCINTLVSPMDMILIMLELDFEMRMKLLETMETVYRCINKDSKIYKKLTRKE